MLFKSFDCFGNSVPLPLEDDLKLEFVDENGDEIKYVKKLEDINYLVYL